MDPERHLAKNTRLVSWGGGQSLSPATPGSQKSLLFVATRRVVMKSRGRLISFTGSALLLLSIGAPAQMIDNTQAPNTAKAGINKSLLNEIGPGRGDVMTSS